MSRIMQFLRDYPALFGRCPRCMRQSYLAAFLAGIVTAALFGFLREINTITFLAATVFLSATLLWISHLAAFAWRVAPGKIRQSSHRNKGASRDRRTALVNFGQAFVAVALATSAMPVRWPLFSHHPDQNDNEPKRKGGTLLAVACWDGKCGSGTYCCQWGDDAWCCQNGTSCDPSIRGCF